VTLCFCIGVALRGVTVRFYPYSIGFVALTVADVIVTCVLLVSVSFILGWVPVGETRAAGRNVALFLQQQGMSDLDGPTELLPLVDYPAGFGLFDRQDSLSLEGGSAASAGAAAAVAAAAAMQRRRGSSGGGGSEGSRSDPP
jgi:hypothetical protein